MGKILKFPTRSFGSDAKEPGVPELAGWVAGRKGSPGDLTLFQLGQYLAPQESAGIDRPCAGGSFYERRVRECLLGIEGSRICGELHGELHPFADDAGTFRPGTWFSLPAPGEIDLIDDYYGDPDEARDALRGVYRQLMRSMRDAGAGGHVLLCSAPVEGDLAALAGRKITFFPRDLTEGTLGMLLEYQREVLVDSDSVSTISGDLMEGFDFTGLILLDPGPGSIREALNLVDPGQVIVGGYCRDECGKYWKDLKSTAQISL